MILPVTLQVGDAVTLNIQDIAFGGEGVGRVDDFVVFVPFVIVGETVVAEITEVKKQFARAKLLRVEQASPERVAPECRYFTQCGGCQYQHLAYAAQLRIKQKQIADLFERPEAFGTAYNVAGSGTITTRDFIERLLRAAGRPVKIRTAGTGMLRVLGLFNPLMRELVEMNYLQSDPVMLDESKLRAVLPGLRKTPYDDGIAATAAAAIARHAAAGSAAKA